jgi:hypothetical protein
MKKQRADYVDPTRSISHIPSQWNRSNTAMKRMLELRKPIPVERQQKGSEIEWRGKMGGETV